MKLLKYTSIAAAFLMYACQSGEDISKSNAAMSTADVILRATSDIQTPSPIKAASFVPNSVASWLGHIILLDGKGTLHRATTDSAKTEVVALGKYSDVIGLSREKKSGVFLALTPQGQIKAFVQTDDDGNYGPMAVSQSEYSFKHFCPSATSSGIRFWAETASNEHRVFSVDIYENTSVTINEVDTGFDEKNLCEARNALNLNADYRVKPSTADTGLTLTSGTESLSVDVTNGLSIGGVTEAGFVTVTDANMGSVYNEGVMLVADKNEGRLVLISLAYALKEIEAR